MIQSYVLNSSRACTTASSASLASSAGVLHFKRSAMKFENFGGEGPGTGTIARLIGPDLSKTMGAGMVDAVIVGADRIAANGDVANKIGTYSLAVLARHHRLPFYVAAPWSTVDLATRSGAEIPIEERESDEVVTFAGKRIAIALTYGGQDPFDSGCVNALRTFQDAYRYTGSTLVGMVYGRAMDAGEILKNRAVMKAAQDLGRELVTGTAPS